MIPFPIIYEDGDMLAVDKPEGLSAIPERDRGGENIRDMLSGHLASRIWVVHRIDKDVSGLMVFARNAPAHRLLCLQFEKREVKKKYLAVAHGLLAQESGEIRRPIRLFGSGRMGVDERRGKPCVTRFEVKERWKAFSLAEVRPETGRRHQIRVHFYCIGHPLAGDRYYGEKKLQQGFGRLMLHALELELTAPSGKKLALAAPLPASFVSEMERLKALPG